MKRFVKRHSWVLGFVLGAILFTGNKGEAIPLDLGTAVPVDTSLLPVTIPDTIGTTGNINQINIYSFNAFSGDILTADVDNGYDGSDNPSAPGTPSPGVDVDLNLWLFDPSGNLLRAGGDGTNGLGALDPGSFETYQGSGYTFDPYLTYSISNSGLYYIAVTIEANHYIDPTIGFNGEGVLDLYPSGGDYTLILSGITPTPVPEPSPFLLLFSGVSILWFFTRSRNSFFQGPNCYRSE